MHHGVAFARQLAAIYRFVKNRGLFSGAPQGGCEVMSVRSWENELYDRAGNMREEELAAGVEAYKGRDDVH